MHRSYCPQADFKSSIIAIHDRHEIHHIKDVLRLKAGDEIVLFNGQNQEALCDILAVKENEVVVKVKKMKEQVQSTVKIILACAVPKKAKFEFIIEKCTELGVHEIIPLKTKRTEVIFSSEKLKSKQERFQKVAINAAKQCKRLDVPTIYPMTPLADALKLFGADFIKLIPSLNGAPQHIRDVLNVKNLCAGIVIFIGPEGDFTPDEIVLATKEKCVPVSLGSTVLKVDTAAISTVALCKFLLYN